MYFEITGQAACKTLVGILSLPGAVFLAFKIAFCTSCSIIGGKKIVRTGTAGESNGMSPALAVLVNKFCSSISLLSLVLAASSAAGHKESAKGGLL